MINVLAVSHQNKEVLRMQITVNKKLFLSPENSTDLLVIERAKEELTIENPKYKKLLGMGKSTWNVPEHLHLFEEEGRVLPRGYLSRITRLLREADASFRGEDKMLTLKEERYTFKGTLRPYQKQAVASWGDVFQGILEAPCGAGKTVMMMKLIAEKKQPSLIIVHTKDLLHQTIEAVEKWLGETPGVITGGEYDVKRITVATIQSLRRIHKTAPILVSFGLIMVDECHHIPAETFLKVVSRFSARYRYGVTATPERRDNLEILMHLALGKTNYRVTHEDLAASGLLVKPSVAWVKTPFRYDYRDDYVNLIQALTEDEVRNKYLVRFCCNLIETTRTVLILSSRVAHCKLLFNQIVFHGYQNQVALITGHTKAKERGRTIEKVRNGEISILIASNIADEGLDIPGLDTLVLATPFRSKERGVQRVGRILRSSEEKNKPLVVDFFDVEVPILRYQAWKRYNEIYCVLAESPPPPSKEIFSIPDESPGFQLQAARG